MDENKDLKTPVDPENSDPVTENTQPLAEEAQAAAEDAAAEKDYSLDNFDDDNDTADAPEEADGTEETDGTEKEPADDETLQPAEEEAAPKRKKPIIQTTIIISLIIVIIAVLATIVVKVFFDKEITGTWHYVREVQVANQGATSDEAESTIGIDYYFAFANDGTVKSTIGTITSAGTYSVSQNEDGQPIVTIDVYDVPTTYFLNGEYTYELKGNIFTGKTLVISKEATDYTGAAKTLTYEMQSESYQPPTLEREDEFEKNDDLIGKWTYSTGEYKLAYEFNDDGTAKYLEQATSINPYTYTPVNIDITMNGIYSVKDDTATITYYYLKQSDKVVQFKREGDILYVNDPSLPLGFLPFTKDGAAPASADEIPAQAQQGQQQAQQPAQQQQAQQATEQATQQAANAQ